MISPAAGTPVPPPYRGRSLKATEVAEMIGGTAEWVKRNMPHKMTWGHSTVRWAENDVREWMENHRAA